MADPLSVTASIIAVLGAAEGVGKALSRIKDLRNAPSDFLALINEVSDLRIILGDVERNVRETERTASLPHEQLAHMSTLIDRAKDRLLELDRLIHYRLIKPTSGDIKVSRGEWAAAKPTIQKFRESLRDIRLNLMTKMLVISSSNQSRINLTIEEIYMISSRRQEAENVQSQQEDHSQLLNRILNNQSELRNLLQVRKPPADHTRSNKAVETDESYPIIGVRAFVSNSWKIPCSLDCKCTCHEKDYLHSCLSMHHIIGLLFVGYSGHPRYVKCPKDSCRAQSVFKVEVNYLFPSWLLTKVVTIALGASAYGGIQISLKIRNIVPPSADIFRLTQNNDVEGLQRLITKRLASPNDSDSFGYTAIQALLNTLTLNELTHFNNSAYDSHAWESCEFLLKVGGDPHLEHFQSRWSPFSSAQDAILQANEDEATLLTLRRLFPDRDGYLEECCFSKLHKIVIGISSSNLEEELIFYRGDIDERDSDGRTALMWAAMKGDRGSVDLLLRANACPNTSCPRGRTPLYFAAGSSNISSVKLLLKAGADISMTTESRSTALLVASYYHDGSELIECLVTAGSDPNQVGLTGHPPLFNAVGRNFVKTSEALLDFGSDINFQDPEGDTPLHQAIWTQALGSTRLLIRRGADLTLRNNDGCNVLHYTAKYGCLETIEILDTAALVGISPDTTAKDGNTALQMAQQRQNEPEDFVERLKKLLDGIRERNAAKAVVESSASGEPSSTGDAHFTSSFGRLSRSKVFHCFIPRLERLWLIQDCLHQRLAQSLWLSVFLSWFVGFGCAGLLYVALRTEAKDFL